MDQLCPADLGWLQPSVAIAEQSIPQGGFDGTVGGLFERWWTEILVIGAMLLGAVWWIVVGIHKRKPLLLLAMAAAFGGLALYLTTRGFVLVVPLGLAAAVSLLAGVVILVRRPLKNRSA